MWWWCWWWLWWWWLCCRLWKRCGWRSNICDLCAYSDPCWAQWRGQYLSSLLLFHSQAFETVYTSLRDNKIVKFWQCTGGCEGKEFTVCVFMCCQEKETQPSGIGPGSEASPHVWKFYLMTCFSYNYPASYHWLHTGSSSLCCWLNNYLHDYLMLQLCLGVQHTLIERPVLLNLVKVFEP